MFSFPDCYVCEHKRYQFCFVYYLSSLKVINKRIITYFTRVLHFAILLFFINSWEYKIANINFFFILPNCLYLFEKFKWDLKVCEMCFSWLYADMNSRISLGIYSKVCHNKSLYMPVLFIFEDFSLVNLADYIRWS